MILGGKIEKSEILTVGGGTKGKCQKETQTVGRRGKVGEGYPSRGGGKGAIQMEYLEG